LHSSPTGELFLTDVQVGADRLLGESEEKAAEGGRAGAKATFQTERAGVAAMALGIIERCLELSLAYAKERVQFGRPIGEFQLIQEKIARMEVARMNVQNLVFRTLELAEAGKLMSLAEASAMKLYAARGGRGVAGRRRSSAATATWPIQGRAIRPRRPRRCHLRRHRRSRSTAIARDLLSRLRRQAS
jgi:alkylation response protein AidB-like acyl-CoA dehydrogenase